MEYPCNVTPQGDGISERRTCDCEDDSHTGDVEPKEPGSQEHTRHTFHLRPPKGRACGVRSKAGAVVSLGGKRQRPGAGRVRVLLDAGVRLAAVTL